MEAEETGYGAQLLLRCSNKLWTFYSVYPRVWRYFVVEGFVVRVQSLVAHWTCGGLEIGLFVMQNELANKQE